MLKKKNKFYAKRIQKAVDKNGNSWAGQWAVCIEVEDGRVFYNPCLHGAQTASILARAWNSDFERSPAKTAARMAHEFTQLEPDNKILVG